jgi:hypothetical protein
MAASAGPLTWVITVADGDRLQKRNYGKMLVQAGTIRYRQA